MRCKYTSNYNLNVLNDNIYVGSGLYDFQHILNMIQKILLYEFNTRLIILLI